jgi:hypothetical protein
MQLLRLFFHGVALTIRSEAEGGSGERYWERWKDKLWRYQSDGTTFNTQFLTYERQ